MNSFAAKVIACSALLSSACAEYGAAPEAIDATSEALSAAGSGAWQGPTAQSDASAGAVADPRAEISAAEMAAEDSADGTTEDAALQSCYGNAVQITHLDPNYHWPPGSSTFTTSNCNDINLYVNQDCKVKTCFKPTYAPEYCTDYRPLYTNTWSLAATDVADGTEFYLVFNRGNVVGWAAY